MVIAVLIIGSELMRAAVCTSLGQLCSCCGRGRRREVASHVRRHVAVQSMTTYTSLRGNATPRFQPINGLYDGVWFEDVAPSI